MLDVENLIVEVVKRRGCPVDEAIEILSCFGYEVNGKFLPVTAAIDGWSQTGLSASQFHEQFKDLLEDRGGHYEEVPVVSARSGNYA